ncbi:hypothetical protein LguiA_003273 [Lonicera macranthoides]
MPSLMFSKQAVAAAQLMRKEASPTLWIIPIAVGKIELPQPVTPPNSLRHQIRAKFDEVGGTTPRIRTTSGYVAPNQPSGLETNAKLKEYSAQSTAIPIAIARGTSPSEPTPDRRIAFIDNPTPMLSMALPARTMNLPLATAFIAIPMTKGSNAKYSVDFLPYLKQRNAEAKKEGREINDIDELKNWGRVKLNIDGCYKGNPDPRGEGCIIRNCNADIVCPQAHYYGNKVKTTWAIHYEIRCVFRMLTSMSFLFLMCSC